MSTAAPPSAKKADFQAADISAKGIPSAIRYSPCPGLWCVTAYYNPVHYRTRRVNYETFASPLRTAGIPLLTVECAFGDDPFDLPPGPDVLQVRGRDVLWQKERLINLGVARLPPEADKVAWLDCDILFANPNWALETAALLDRVAVVQPWEKAVLLKQGDFRSRGEETEWDCFAKVTARDSQALTRGYFGSHGHTGFAWAARRSFWTAHGLYEAFLSGNGDHYMAHAFLGDLESPCMVPLRHIFRPHMNPAWTAWQKRLKRVSRLIPPGWKSRVRRIPGVSRPTGPFWEHFDAWAAPVTGFTDGKLGWIPGKIHHLWHGEVGEKRGTGMAGWP